MKPYVDLQPYEDPSKGVLEFTKELDPSVVTIETVIGEGKCLWVLAFSLLGDAIVLFSYITF